MKILKIFLFFISTTFVEVSHSEVDPFQDINEKTHNFNQFLDSGLASPGVGMGGNGTHIGSTANVYIVTVSEKLAKTTGNPDLAITPLKWAQKGLPVMLLTLVICTVI